MKKLLFLLSVTVIILGLVLVGHGQAAPKSYPALKWKAVSGWDKTNSGYYPNIEAWQRISDQYKAIGGSLEIEWYDPKLLMPTNAVLSAVGDGSIQLGSGYATWFPETPEQAGQILNGLPMAWTTPEDARSIYYEHGLLDLLRKRVYDKLNVHMLPMSATGPYGLSTNFKITGLDSLKRRKIRANTTYAKFMGPLGVVPTTIPGSEMYMALKLHTIDGIIWGMSTYTSMNLGEVLTDAWLPAWSFPPLAPNFINMDVWNGLPDELKNMIEDECKKILISDAYNAKARADKDIKATGIRVYHATAEEQAILKQHALAQWRDKAKDGPISKAAVEILTNYYHMTP